jgi:hypothetical protein
MGVFALTGGSIPYSPAIFARCATSASTASSAGEGERQKFQHKPPAGFECDLKATAMAADGE